VVEEPSWIPGYIYGLNYTGQEELKDGKFPHYTRWRLEALERARQGELVIALSPEPQTVKVAEETILIPNGGVLLGQGKHMALGVTCACECLIWDEEAQRVTAIGATSLRLDAGQLHFKTSVDLEYAVTTRRGQAFAASAGSVTTESFHITPWMDAGAEAAKTHGRLLANFHATDQSKGAQVR
jgi:hypothetical protein